MKNKELLFKAFRHEKLEATPWVPFAGVHAGKLKGYTAKEVLTDKDKLYESLMEVNRLYKPHGQPVLFDLQIEAEILGCDLVWSQDGPPSVASHPLEGDNPIVPCICTLPEKTDGRIPLALDVMNRLKKSIGDTTALFGLICGPFTLASHLRGNDIFMDMFDDEEYVIALLEYAQKVGERMAEYYMEAGMDIIAVVDPLISQISPEHFEKFMSVPFKALFDKIRAKGAFSSFFVCGNATRNIEVMCKTGCDAIFVDENVDLPAAKHITDRYHITIGGNIPLTSVMLHGTQLDNMKYAIDLLDKIENKDNYIMAPGCDMPYAVPIENAIGVAQAVLDPTTVRKMVENYQSKTELPDVTLPDYTALKKPLIEVLTLDSATCAACTYMWSSVKAIADKFGDKVDIIEYKYIYKENIARCIKMGVSNLPCVYINGQLKFSSIIPNPTELEHILEQTVADMSKK